MIGHILLALLIQLIVALPCRSLAAGAAAACTWSIAREITQAEYRWIEHYGHGLRANMPWWGGLDQRVWQNPDPWLDWVIPSLVALLIAFIATTRTARQQ